MTPHTELSPQGIAPAPPEEPQSGAANALNVIAALVTVGGFIVTIIAGMGMATTNDSQTYTLAGGLAGIVTGVVLFGIGTIVARIHQIELHLRAMRAEKS